MNQCPICGGSCRLLDVVDFNKSCMPTYELEGTPVYYTKCTSCDFCFAPKMCNWSLEQFSQYVYNDEYISVDPDYPTIRPSSNAELLLRTFPQLPAIRHLDYGGGAGLLSQRLCESGWNSQSYDPFVNGTLTFDRQYDLITAFEVFEHVPNVEKLMSNLKRLLATDGVVLFSTLLSDSHIAHGKRLDWWYASPRNGHISLFSRKSLQILAETNGLRVCSFSSSMHAFWINTPSWATHVIPI